MRRGRREQKKFVPFCILCTLIVQEIMALKCLLIHDSLGVKAVHKYTGQHLLHMQDPLNSLLQEEWDYALALFWLASDDTTSQII